MWAAPRGGTAQRGGGGQGGPGLWGQKARTQRTGEALSLESKHLGDSFLIGEGHSPL